MSATKYVDVSKIGSFTEWIERYRYCLEKGYMHEMSGLIHDGLMADIRVLCIGYGPVSEREAEMVLRIATLMEIADEQSGLPNDVRSLARNILAFQVFEKQETLESYSGPGPFEFNRVFSSFIIEHPRLCQVMVDFFRPGAKGLVNIPMPRTHSEKNVFELLFSACRSLCYLLNFQKKVGYSNSAYESKCHEYLGYRRQAFGEAIAKSMFVADPMTFISFLSLIKDDPTSVTSLIMMVKKFGELPELNQKDVNYIKRDITLTPAEVLKIVCMRAEMNIF